MTSTTASSFDVNALKVSREHLDARPDELIVALPYTDLVIETISRMALPVEVVRRDPSQDLGLELLSLKFDREFLGKIAPQLDKAKDPCEEARQPFEPDDRIGPLIAILKYEIGRRSGGWYCTMGRNRELGHLTATDGRVISHSDDPKPAPEVEYPSLQQLRESAGPPARKVVVGIADTALWEHSWYESADIVRTGPYLDPAPPDPHGENPYRTGHSTFVSGIVLTRAPWSRLQVSGVLNSDGVGDSWQVANAIVALGKTGIDILNLSFCQFTFDARQPLALATAIDRLDPNIVVVAGAGNYGARSRPVPAYKGGPTIDLSVSPTWPAALDDVIAVGASIGDSTDAAVFSPTTPWVDILAPGDTVISTFVPELLSPQCPFASWSGTSFSTAVISGMIAARMALTGNSAREAWQEINAASRIPPPNLAVSGTDPLTRVVSPADVRPVLLGPRTTRLVEPEPDDSTAD